MSGGAASREPSGFLTGQVGWEILLGIIGVVFVIGVRGVGYPLVGDDQAILVASDRLHGLGHWRDILTMPYWPPPMVPDLYRPVTSLMLAMEYGLGGGSPVVFRLVSLGLYVAVILGVLRLGLKVLPRPIAIGLTFAFAAHPVHVEALVYAVGQAELVVAITSLWAVSAYLDRRSESAVGGGARFWIMLAALYAVGSLAKEHGLMLPLLLASAEVFLVADPRPLRKRIGDLWPGFISLALVGAAVIIARTVVLGGAIGAPTDADGLPAGSFPVRVLTFLQVVPEWLRLFAWPVHLRSSYGAAEFVRSASFGAAEARGLALVLGALAVAFVARRRAPLISFGIAWMVATLLPLSNLLAPTAILIAERTLFLPSTGFLLAVCGALALAARLVAADPRRARAAAGVAVGAAVLIFGATVRSVRRVRDWRDVDTIVLAGLRDQPRNAGYQADYADLLAARGRGDEAIAAYRRSVEYAPVKFEFRNRLATELRVAGLNDEALAIFRQSLAERPDQVAAAVGVTTTLLVLGRYAEARSVTDSIIASVGGHPAMLRIRFLADSGLASKAPPGSIQLGVRRP